MKTSYEVEAIGGKQSNKKCSRYLMKFEGNNDEVKPLSRHGSPSSSSSWNYSQDFENNNNDDDDNNDDIKHLELYEFTSTSPSYSSSTEQSPERHMTTKGQISSGYDPNRIPSSVFSGKPATLMEWSIASSESLFSLHAGNNSFSRDQFGMFYKSEELTKLDEQIIAHGNLLPPLKKLEDMASKDKNIDDASPSTGISMVVEAETNEVAEDHIDQNLPLAEKLSPSPITNSPTIDFGVNFGSHSHSQEIKFQSEVHISQSKSISAYSDESCKSTLSFVFPVLTGTDAGRLSSVKGEQNIIGLQIHSENQQQQKEQKQGLQPAAPVSTQIASIRRWFSRFYCCGCS